MKPKCFFRVSLIGGVYVCKELLPLLVNYGFDVPGRKIEFLGKSFKCNAVQQPSLQQVAVTLGEDPLVDERLPLASWDVPRSNVVFHLFLLLTVVLE